MTLLRRLIPSMFERRLWLLFAAIGLGMLILGGRLVHLTVLQGAENLQRVEQVLMDRRLIPTVRGRILDRKGRELAVDSASFDVLVDYPVITGQWAYDKAAALARRDHRPSWSKLDFDQREQLIAQYLPVYQRQLKEVWQALSRAGGVESAKLEDRRAAVIQRVQDVRAHLWSKWQEQRSKLLDRPVELDEVADVIREERESHTFLTSIAREEAYELMQLSESGRLPGVTVERSRQRVYPFNGVTEVELSRRFLPAPLAADGTMTMAVESPVSSLIGSMRPVWAEDIPRRPYDLPDGAVDLSGYRSDDAVGSSGIESAEEGVLRGARGQVLRRRDDGSETRQTPMPGQDVVLSIDVQLQARITALMDPKFGLMRVQDWHENEALPNGTSLYGAAVVMEVNTGELLAMVSTPTVPPAIPGEPAPDLMLDPNGPLFNKPLQAIYPPGSTLKPLIYAMAAARGKVQWDQAVECKGHLLENDEDHYRCWTFRPSQGFRLSHGPLQPIEAIARSCNIYFYTCGQRMGPELLVEEMHKWGFGELTDVGLPGSTPGIMPDLASPHTPGREFSTPNAIMMGIGQGPIAVTPLHVVAAHGALARGGEYLSPLLVLHRRNQQAYRDLRIPSRVLSNALKGMEDSANAPHGTAHELTIFGSRERTINLDGVTIRAKTGTAQAPNQYELVRRVGSDGQERVVPNRDRILRSGSHGWYLMHVQRPDTERASYIVAVLVEYGGSGGKVAGPVANQILHALKAEGYL